MNICKVETCNRPIGDSGARGLCPLHYRRLMRTGDVMANKPPEQKRPSDRACKIKGCGVRVAAWDMCQKHYLRTKAHGDPQASHPQYRKKIRWIEGKVSYSGDDCLEWPFSVGDHGRGTVTINKKTLPAPRYMCILAHGEPPTPEHHAAHICGKGHEGCVNPRHLVWKTPKDNEADKIRHGTLRRGTAINTNKLTENDVRAIRKMIGKSSGVEIARTWGITPAMVSRIKKRQAWAWLDD